MINMHDWTLLSIRFDWKQGKVSIEFEPYNTEKIIVFFYAEDVSNLQIPRVKEWGPSVSVNEVTGPEKLSGENQKIKFEMQTSDVIEITAKKFIFPKEANWEGGNK